MPLNTAFFSKELNYCLLFSNEKSYEFKKIGAISTCTDLFPVNGLSIAWCNLPVFECTLRLLKYTYVIETNLYF